MDGSKDLVAAKDWAGIHSTHKEAVSSWVSSFFVGVTNASEKLLLHSSAKFAHYLDRMQKLETALCLLVLLSKWWKIQDVEYRMVISQSRQTILHVQCVPLMKTWFCIWWVFFQIWCKNITVVFKDEMPVSLYISANDKTGDRLPWQIRIVLIVWKMT